MTRSTDALSREIIDAVEQQREDVVALCASLVAAPSVNPPGDTRQVADVVSGALTARGLPSRQLHTDPVMPSVVAELDSGRPGPHLILNVHLDTMPPGDESAWSQPVWSLTRTEGRLYGLGMGNMKGAVAAMITATALLAERSAHWAGKITFTAVSDEVVFGDNGAAHLLRKHPQWYGDGLLCGEGPGFRRLAIGEKGVLWVELTATGPAGHSSAVTAGTSASARIAAAITAVDALTGTPGVLPDELAALAVGRDTSDPDPGLLLTANIGTVTAGTFIGQIATAARAEVDLRLPPGLDTSEALALVHKAVSEVATAQVRQIKGWDANWTTPEAPLTQAWQRAARTVSGSPSEYAIRLPASDASRWRRNGVPALCFGPQPTWSAGIDDYADEDEVLRCAALYAVTALNVLRSRP